MIIAGGLVAHVHFPPYRVRPQPLQGDVFDPARPWRQTRGGRRSRNPARLRDRPRRHRGLLAPIRSLGLRPRRRVRSDRPSAHGREAPARRLLHALAATAESNRAHRSRVAEARRATRFMCAAWTCWTARRFSTSSPTCRASRKRSSAAAGWQKRKRGKSQIRRRLRDSQNLVRLQAQAPLRMLEAIARAPAWVFASRSGPSIGCRKKCRKRERRSSPDRRPSADRPASIHRRCPAPARRRPWGSRRPSRDPPAPRWSRWSRRQFQSRARAAPRSGLASSCSSGSPPVQTTNRLPGRCSPPATSSAIAAASASADLKFSAAGPIHIRKIGIAEFADRRGAVLLRAPTRDCSPQSGRRPRRGRSARLRPATYRRFLYRVSHKDSFQLSAISFSSRQASASRYDNAFQSGMTKLKADS